MRLFNNARVNNFRRKPMQSVRCGQCGLLNWADAETCKRCALALSQSSELTQSNESNFGSAPDQTFNPSYQQNHQSTQQSPDPRFYRPNSQTYANASQAKKRTGLAIASLIVGIISFFTFGLLFVGAITGIVLGVMALNKAKSNPAVYGGQGLAIGGIVTSALSLLIIIPLGIITAIAIPNLLAARRAANEGAAIQSLRTICSAEETYKATTGAGSYGTLEELSASNLIDPRMASGGKSGYAFSITATRESFAATATPLKADDVGRTGTRSFYVSSTDFTLHGADKHGREADMYDPQLGTPPANTSPSTYSSQPPVMPTKSYAP
jgi:type II secretory pathway pseudopilin PulG